MEREADRRAAIARAVELAEPGDVVVIAGKGHEQGQEHAGGRKEPFDDVEVARAALRATGRGCRRERGREAPREALDRPADRRRGRRRAACAASTRAAEGPARVVIDSRAIEPGDLFVALPGERVDGGEFAADALRAGAWGVLAAPVWAREAAARRPTAAPCSRPSTRSRRSARWRAPGGATSPRT